MTDENLKLNFDTELDEKLKDYPDIDTELVHKEEFILLCQKFVNISLKAPKCVIPGTTELQASFQYADMDAAKAAFLRFCDLHGIEDKKMYLDFIQLVSPWSVYHDNTMSGAIMNPNHTGGSGNFGSYYDITVLPDDTWEYLKNRILGD